MLAGFVAGEGSFSVTRRLPPFADGSMRLRFVFQVAVAEHDRHLLAELRAVLGFGSIRTAPRREPHHLDVAVLSIGSFKAHHAATIPFFDQYLLPSAKRRQFDAWCASMDDYERRHPPRYGKGPSTCSEDGCDRPVRGRGLCRRHYYRVTGY